MQKLDLHTSVCWPISYYSDIFSLFDANILSGDLKEEAQIRKSCYEQQKLLECKKLLCLLSTVYLERKKVKKWKVLSVTMPPLRVYSELWEGAGLKCRDGASHDQLKWMCVFFCKVWPCYKILLWSCTPFCYRPLPLPRPFLAVGLNS